MGVPTKPLCVTTVLCQLRMFKLERIEAMCKLGESVLTTADKCANVKSLVGPRAVASLFVGATSATHGADASLYSVYSPVSWLRMLLSTP